MLPLLDVQTKREKIWKTQKSHFQPGANVSSLDMAGRQLSKLNGYSSEVPLEIFHCDNSWTMVHTFVRTFTTAKAIADKIKHS